MLELVEKDAVGIEDPLACQAWEFANVIRVPVRCEEDLMRIGAQLADANVFVAVTLPRVAKQLGADGNAVVFQALITQCKPGAHIASATFQSTAPACVSRVDLERLGCTEVGSLAAGAKELCDLLRVKIGDDSDLVLARHVSQDCLRFLEHLREYAQRRGISSWQLFAKLQDECH